MRLTATSRASRPIDPASRALVVTVGGVPRRLVKSCRRQTAAWAGGRRRRSARCGGGSPDSAGGARVRPRACGMGAWVGQHFGGVHACLTTAGVARRDEQPPAVGVVTQPHLTENPLARECARRRSWRPRRRRSRRTDRSR